MKSFEEKVALVTGAGGGIGLATARAFAEAGASVMMADSNAALLEEAASALRSAGHEVLAVTCDVRDRNQVSAMRIWVMQKCFVRSSSRWTASLTTFAMEA